MKKYLIKLILTLFITAMTPACSPDPVVLLENKLYELEDILKYNNNDPDNMLLQLREFTQKNRDFWIENQKQINNMDVEKVDRASAVRETQIQEHYINITNLILEYQHRFRNQPEKIAELTALMRQITTYEHHD